MKFWHLLTLSSLGTFAIAQEDLVDIPTTAANAGSYKTILTAIEAAGLSEILSGEGPYTVFAPSDAVFVGLDPALVPCLMAQPEALAAVLKYHVLPMKLESTKIIQTIDMEVETLNGENLSIDVVNGARVVLNDDVNVVTADISASNGVIHEIDGVLIPPTIEITAITAFCDPTAPPTDPSTAHSVSTKMFLLMAAALSLVVAVAM